MHETEYASMYVEELEAGESPVVGRVAAVQVFPDPVSTKLSRLPVEST